MRRGLRATNARGSYRIGTRSRIIFELGGSARQATSSFELALCDQMALCGELARDAHLSLCKYVDDLQEGDQVIACVCEQRLGSWRHGVVANLDRHPPRNEVGRQCIASRRS